MKDEFNKDLNEFTPIKENEVAKENIAAKENITAKENVEAKEFTDPIAENSKEQAEIEKAKKDKKTKTLSLMTGSLTAIVGAVIIGMTNYMNVRMNLSFSKFEYVDSTINYEIKVDDMTAKETIKLYVYEENVLVDNKPIEYVFDDVDEGKITATFTVDPEHIKDLLTKDPDHSIAYRFDLKGIVGLNVERAFDSYVLKIDEVKSEFDIGNIDYWCSCGVDHCYNFWMHFSDDFGKYSDFEAFIEDEFGNISYCEWTDNIHDAQKINVLNMVGSAATLTISFQVEGEAERTVITQKINL